jgi:glycosyltransferase involved in cell wall biosynthesis
MMLDTKNRPGIHHNTPKISIVTPSYNQVRFLEAAIQSVLSQNYPNLEYIIIDGGSTDGSLDIIRKYENQLSYWCSEPDNGQYDAINKGLTKSTGEIMAWINSDDMYFPWTLKTVASIFFHLPQVKWLTTLQQGQWDWHGFFLGVKPIPGYSQEAFWEGRYLPGANREAFGHIQQESTFWSRTLWEKAGGYIAKDIPLAGDFELWCRFYRHADLFGVLSPLGGFRYHVTQRSAEHCYDYLQEARQALGMFRCQVQCSPNSLRTLAERWHLTNIPGMRHLARSLWAYRGKQVIRENLGSADNHWSIKDYYFL